MARNEIQVEAAPEAVFAVLCDPRSYARWVVGSRAVRAADPQWPAPGSAFDHAVGIGPLLIADHTRVLECEPPRMLSLLVNARPLSRATVVLRLRPASTGTHVTMEEDAADTRSLLLFNFLTSPLVRLRNAESLRRLRALAEGREPIPAGPLPPRDAPEEGMVTGSSAPARP